MHGRSGGLRFTSWIRHIAPMSVPSEGIEIQTENRRERVFANYLNSLTGLGVSLAVLERDLTSRRLNDMYQGSRSKCTEKERKVQRNIMAMKLDPPFTMKDFVKEACSPVCGSLSVSQGSTCSRTAQDQWDIYRTARECVEKLSKKKPSSSPPPLLPGLEPVPFPVPNRDPFVSSEGRAVFGPGSPKTDPNSDENNHKPHGSKSRSFSFAHGMIEGASSPEIDSLLNSPLARPPPPSSPESDPLLRKIKEKMAECSRLRQERKITTRMPDDMIPTDDPTPIHNSDAFTTYVPDHERVPKVPALPFEESGNCMVLDGEEVKSIQEKLFDAYVKGRGEIASGIAESESLFNMPSKLKPTVSPDSGGGKVGNRVGDSASFGAIASELKELAESDFPKDGFSPSEAPSSPMTSKLKNDIENDMDVLFLPLLKERGFKALPRKCFEEASDNEGSGSLKEFELETILQEAFGSVEEQGPQVSEEESPPRSTPAATLSSSPPAVQSQPVVVVVARRFVVAHVPAFERVVEEAVEGTGATVVRVLRIVVQATPWGEEEVSITSDRPIALKRSDAVIPVPHPGGGQTVTGDFDGLYDPQHPDHVYRMRDQARVSVSGGNIEIGGIDVFGEGFHDPDSFTDGTWRAFYDNARQMRW